MACYKVKHKTVTAAQLQIASLVQSKKYSGKKLSVYYCDECDAYHTTQMDQRLAKKIQKKRRGIW